MNNLETMRSLELAEKEYATSNTSIRDISKKFGVQRQILTGWLLAKGYTIYNRRANKSANIHYFDVIDTEDKAYWLGFLFADGAITKHNVSYNIELSLQISDKEHVEKFAKALNKTKVNNNSTYRSRCVIGSKHMFEILEKYGCTCRKSLTLQFPDLSIFQDITLVRHFIRGYVDGDGCLSYGNKSHSIANVTVLGTSEFLDGIQKVYSHKYQKYCNANSGQHITKTLSYRGKSAFMFANWLYKDAKIYLERKYLKYLEYCRLYEESYKESEDKFGEDCEVNTELTDQITKG